MMKHSDNYYFNIQSLVKSSFVWNSDNFTLPVRLRIAKHNKTRPSNVTIGQIIREVLNSILG